ncbi:MAG: hypothetical protein GY749_00670 [Desulfobacteraceae bacterium]|nr:hypothetical protein [Desulfobacteraceae bacterium]
MNSCFKPVSTANRKKSLAICLFLALFLTCFSFPQDNEQNGYLSFATECHAATIQGVKFYDKNSNGLFDTSEKLFAKHNIYIRELDTSTNLTFKTDANGQYCITDLSAGTFLMWSGIYEGWTQTSPIEGADMVIYTVKVDAAQTLTVNFGITDTGPPPVPPVDACAEIPTATSVSSGEWSDPGTWGGTIPVANDWVRIEDGHSITVPNYIDLENGGLCNKGEIQSLDNIAGVSPSKVEIHASSVHNSGDIKGKNGVNGFCGRYDISGSSIEVWSTLFINDTTGSIEAGNGGTDVGGCNIGTCPGVGGSGGKVEVFSVTTIHEGAVIRSGNGGNAFGCHANTYGGSGGIIRVITNAFDSNNQSKSVGMVITGDGGNATSQAGMAFAGRGGDADLFMNNVNGVVRGTPGSRFHWDPVSLKAGSDLNISGFDDVEVYTDQGGSIDLRELSEGAVSATNTITIAVGEGGSVDLRGLNSKVFTAGEKIEIFADNILLDSSVTFNDLADAPDVVIGPAKILYRVGLSADTSVAGEAGTKVTVPIKLVNSGPEIDTFSLRAVNSEYWTLRSLPYNVTMGGLMTRMLYLDVYFPETSGAKTDITVTATSTTDPTVSATAKITAFVKPSEGELADPDNDGLNTYQENQIGTDPYNDDSDDDIMKDGWEVNYRLDPLSDDSGEDPDNDGYTNLEEYEADTNPRDPDSKPDECKIDGDIDNDGDVDRYDVQIINTYRDKPASFCPECDIDENGTINILDARKLALMFCSESQCPCE